MSLVKTNRQLNYESLRGENSQHFKVNETPFTVGLGLHVHKVTRNKSLVDLLSNLNLSTPYNKVMKIETAIGNACIKDMEGHNGTYIPPNIVVGKPIHFAIDDTHFKNDTPDGKSEFHGTGHVVFQKLDETWKERT